MPSRRRSKALGRCCFFRRLPRSGCSMMLRRRNYLPDLPERLMPGFLDRRRLALCCVSWAISHFLISFLRAFSFSACFSGSVIIVFALTVVEWCGDKCTGAACHLIVTGAAYLQC